MNRKTEGEEGRGWRVGEEREKREQEGVIIWASSVLFLLSPSSQLCLWCVCARACMCVFVRVCIWGMCFHTEDIPRRALSIHQHSVCPLTDPDTHTPHGCVRECVNDCACYIVLAWMCTIDHASETVTAYVCMWNVMCKYVCVKCVR